MSTFVFSDIYDCAACGEALAYPVDEEGEALDGGDLVCLTCVLSYVVDMRTGTLTRASEFIERLTAELEEARLTLAAERGEAAGGPPGWVYEPGDEDFDEPGEWVNANRSLKVWKSGTGWVWGCRIANGAYQGPRQQPEGQTARAAILAASAAHFPTPETDRP